MNVDVLVFILHNDVLMRSYLFKKVCLLFDNLLISLNMLAANCVHITVLERSLLSLFPVPAPSNLFQLWRPGIRQNVEVCKFQRTMVRFDVEIVSVKLFTFLLKDCSCV